MNFYKNTQFALEKIRSPPIINILNYVFTKIEYFDFYEHIFFLQKSLYNWKEVTCIKITS